MRLIPVVVIYYVARMTPVYGSKYIILSLSRVNLIVVVFPMGLSVFSDITAAESSRKIFKSKYCK
ncbi:MAG: hypothetical protein ACP5UZ_06960 [Thermoplasmata archaeon]